MIKIALIKKKLFHSVISGQVAFVSLFFENVTYSYHIQNESFTSFIQSILNIYRSIEVACIPSAAPRHFAYVLNVKFQVSSKQDRLIILVSWTTINVLSLGK